jgi:hypothetical protein
MTRLPRVAPTPAAVVTYVAIGTYSLMYTLISAHDSLQQIGSGEWAWPLDPATIVRDSAGWAIRVALWCAVAWVVGRRNVWRAVALAVVTVVGWTVLAWRSFHDAFLVEGWFVPWPGPVPGLQHVLAADLVDVGLEPQVGIVTPLALVAALTVTAWLAHRRSLAEPPTALAGTSGARRLMLSVLALPVVSAIVAASLLQLAPADDFATSTQRYADVLVSHTFALVLAVGAAVLLAGTGRAGWVLLGLVSLMTFGPLVLGWLSGGPDSLLGTTVLGVVGVGLAAAAHPIATALSRLDQPRPGTAASVPERADAHH